jgi:hypothetical protein
LRDVSHQKLCRVPQSDEPHLLADKSPKAKPKATC